MKLRANPYMAVSINGTELVIPLQSGQNYVVSDLLQTVGEIDVEREYDVKIERRRLRRSLNANRYAWVLTGKLADALRIDKDECHRLMLARYGQTATDSEGNALIFSALATVPEAELTKHLGYIAPIKESWLGEKKFIHYRVLKGSSEFDSREMSVFIDGIVDECKELGIETLPPDELARMKATWGV